MYCLDLGVWYVFRKLCQFRVDYYDDPAGTSLRQVSPQFPHRSEVEITNLVFTEQTMSSVVSSLCWLTNYKVDWLFVFKGSENLRCRFTDCMINKIRSLCTVFWRSKPYSKYVSAVVSAVLSLCRKSGQDWLKTNPFQLTYPARIYSRLIFGYVWHNRWASIFSCVSKIRGTTSERIGFFLVV